MQRTAAPAAVALALAGIPSLAPTAVHADDFGFREYTYKDNTCAAAADPVNFFYGKSLGTPSEALRVVESVLDMTVSIFQRDQYFYDVDASVRCQKQDFNRANSAWPPREHTRLNFSARIDPQFTYITAGPIHHDVYAQCAPPDKTDSYNAPRDWAAQRIQSAGYFAVYSFTGNTSGMVQCDGTVVASDGYYVLARN